MTWIVLAFIVLVLLLTGVLADALVVIGWIIAAVLGVVILAWVCRSLLRDVFEIAGDFIRAIAEITDDATCWVLRQVAPEVAQRVERARAGRPLPGDPDYFDWANSEGRYASSHSTAQRDP